MNMPQVPKEWYHHANNWIIYLNWVFATSPTMNLEDDAYVKEEFKNYWCIAKHGHCKLLMLFDSI
jgi:hypothetical protein